jgi:SAM-dependent methyltransferase
VEVDEALADALRGRLGGTNVEVIWGDGADTGLGSNRFSAATAFSVLHHVPTAEHQDRILAEIHRLLRPGGIFAGIDSLDRLRTDHDRPDRLPLPVRYQKARRRARSCRVLAPARRPRRRHRDSQGIGQGI